MAEKSEKPQLPQPLRPVEEEVINKGGKGILNDLGLGESELEILTEVYVDGDNLKDVAKRHKHSTSNLNRIISKAVNYLQNRFENPKEN